MTEFYVFLGGGLGALSRYTLSSSLTKLSKETALHQFPIGIMTCNILGCFLIGCLFGYFAQKTAPSWLFPLLATGFLGGFTTLSTFSKDTHDLWTSGLTGLALLQVILTLILSLSAVTLGIKLSS